MQQESAAEGAGEETNTATDGDQPIRATVARPPAPARPEEAVQGDDLTWGAAVSLPPAASSPAPTPMPSSTTAQAAANGGSLGE